MKRFIKSTHTRDLHRQMRVQHKKHTRDISINAREQVEKKINVRCRLVLNLLLLLLFSMFFLLILVFKTPKRTNLKICVMPFLSHTSLSKHLNDFSTSTLDLNKIYSQD